MSKKKKVNLCIVKASKKLRKALSQRLSDPVFGSLSDICEDAMEKGMKIDKSGLSKYLTKEFPISGALTQEQILWLAVRYSIDIKLKIEVELINEEQAFLNLQKTWGPFPKQI